MNKTISDYMSKQGRKGGEAKTEAKAEAARANGAKGGRPYAYIVRHKINGVAVSRHATMETAARAIVRGSTDRDPLEVISYSPDYWKQMH